MIFIRDLHHYPDAATPAVEVRRVAVLGEFGGLGHPIRGHLWNKDQGWGYRTYKTQKELRAAYKRLISDLPSLRKMGLCAAVYTQTTDVETEVNGLVTYDRAVVKLGLPVSQVMRRSKRKWALPMKSKSKLLSPWKYM